MAKKQVTKKKRGGISGKPHVIGRACKKCGSKDVSILHVPIGGGYLSGSGWIHAVTEFLHIRCKVCSFDWKEDTLDKK